MTVSNELQARNGSGGTWTDLLNAGLDVTPGATVYVRRKDATGANGWTLTTTSSDETYGGLPVLYYDAANDWFTFTYNADVGHALKLLATIAYGGGTAFVTATACVYTLTAAGLRVGAFGETTEGSAYGWIPSVNSIIRSSGGGGSGIRVRAVSTGNVTLSGPQTVDGVSLVAGDYAFVPYESTAANRRVYKVASGAWTPAWLNDGDSAAAAVVEVTEGTTYHDTRWVCTNDVGSDVVGTDTLVWALCDDVVGLYATLPARALRGVRFDATDGGEFVFDGTLWRSKWNNVTCIVPPLAATWAAGHAFGTPFSLTDKAGALEFLPNGSSLNRAGYVIPIAGSTVDNVFEFGFESTTIITATAAINGFGLGLWESSTDKLCGAELVTIANTDKKAHEFRCGNSAAAVGTDWTTPGVGTYKKPNIVGGPAFIRLSIVANNINATFSTNRQSWVPMGLLVAKTVAFTTAPTHVGYFGNSNGEHVSYSTIFHFTQG